LQIPHEAGEAVAPAARAPRHVLRALGILAVVALVAAPKVWPGAALKSQLADMWGDVAAPLTAVMAQSTVVAAPPRVQRAAAPIRVSGAVVQPELLAEVVTSTGTLLAAEGVELQAEVSGKITAIAFVEGARVRKGDLLVKLNDADLAAMRVAASYELEHAKRVERRAAELLEQGFVREDEYDAALSAVHVRQAELALTEAQIAKTEIRAPFDGIAGLRYVSEGAFVNAATRIATLQRTDTLKLDFAVPERYSQMIRSGSRVSFTVAGDEHELGCEVYAFDPRIDAATRTLLIRALCPNPRAALFPGAFANVKLTLDELPNALLVPAAALVPDYEAAYVFVIDGGKAERRRVTIGIRTDSRVQIVAGLEPGEVVATSGLQQLRPGAAVEAVLPQEGSAPAR
jgi:membrane fusion protein (multidrug efflux system)